MYKKIAVNIKMKEQGDDEFFLETYILFVILFI